mmetsp:Transcript_23671/g.43993  ORF Transcript_23671/g.43993 Transcript_23671/m.43993 type:complete len:104 (+) Transcript_23671:767-1078(+)
MDHTASMGAGTAISPAIRLEFGEVLSILTATNSQDSALSISLCSVPPNHHTFNAEEEGDDDDRDGVDGTERREFQDRSSVAAVGAVGKCTEEGRLTDDGNSGA